MINKTIRQRTHEGVDNILDRAESMRDSSQEKFNHLKGNVDGYIQKNPEKSVLIAAGVGAVLGAIGVATMMRRKD